MSNQVRQMFDHTLEPVKGWFHDSALEFTGKMSANVTISPVFAGRVVHVNSVGQFEMGATGHQMPIFLFQNSDDPDVQRDADPTNGIYGVGGNIMSGWVASGPYEIEDTEYDTAQTYAPNDLIRAQASNSVSATGGVLTNSGVTLYTNCVCGVVSRGVITNANNRTVLAMWTVFLPGSGA